MFALYKPLNIVVLTILGICLNFMFQILAIDMWANLNVDKQFLMMATFVWAIIPIGYLGIRRWKIGSLVSFLPQVLLFGVITTLIQFAGLSFVMALNLLNDNTNWTSTHTDIGMLIVWLGSTVWLVTKGKYTYVSTKQSLIAFAYLMPVVIMASFAYKYLPAAAFLYTGVEYGKWASLLAYIFMVVLFLGAPWKILLNRLPKKIKFK